MQAQVRILAFVIVFVAVFTLFFIFDHLQKLADKCRVEKTEVCEKLSGFSVYILIILLMVGGLSLIVCSVAYVLLTFK
jgi:D-alanyl-lipoteichoic acid acyltransferase DltB (MBOAT superfamily)